MSERRTQQVVDLGSSLEFTDEDGGTVRAYFPLLDVQGRGGDREEAFRALLEQLDVITQSDEKAARVFSEWASDHIVEREMSDDEIAAEDAIESKAAEAGGDHFRALTSSDFDSAIATEKPLLVDFWAEWCRPCLMLAPILAELHDELSDRFDVAKLNVDENPDVSDRYGVQGIPCMILFRKGAEVGRIVGMAPKEHLRPQLMQLLET